MKTRAQALAEKRARAASTRVDEPALALQDLAVFLHRSGCSLHLRASARGFAVVAHRAGAGDGERRASDAEGIDLEAGLRAVMGDFDRE